VPTGRVMTADNWIDLKCHLSTRSQSVRAVQVLVRRSGSAQIQTSFRVHGDISRIRVAPPGVPRFAVQLWQHTCFEAFIAVEGQAAYHEFNFAPSGEWAVYAFRGYRNGDPLADQMLRPRIAVRSSANQFELDALVRLDFLSAIQRRASFRVGLSVVVEADDGLSYWALRHPADKPDFHDAEGFAMLLEASESKW
jgi:hypothetical protein